MRGPRDRILEPGLDDPQRQVPLGDEFACLEQVGTDDMDAVGYAGRQPERRLEQARTDETDTGVLALVVTAGLLEAAKGLAKFREIGRTAELAGRGQLQMVDTDAELGQRLWLGDIR
jgi:hypothetical protein